MAKGQLPKAYLRIDPNIDQTHPDCGAFVRLLCAGARQPKRGRFKDRRVLDTAIGKRAAAASIQRGDVKEAEGRLVIDGWDLWQEGDLTVGERMARYRERHSRNEAVTSDGPSSVTPASPPSEALGSKALGTDNGSSISPSVQSEQAVDVRESPEHTSAAQQAYIGACWQFLCERRQANLPEMSSADFDQARKWIEAGIPLRVALRGLADCSKPPPTLRYADPAVREAHRNWARTLQGVANG